MAVLSFSWLAMTWIIQNLLFDAEKGDFLNYGKSSEIV